MSNWTTRLPFAQRYIAKTWFEGAQADLDLPDEITEPKYRIGRENQHLKRLTSHYYELSISHAIPKLTPEKRGWLSIGYTGYRNTIVYYGNDGGILTDTNVNRPHRMTDPYDGDTVGCGYEPPSRFFFTKNGRYLGHCIAQLGLDALRPEVRAWTLGIDCYEPINLGQRPFMFDIEGHFAKRYTRWQSLPPEIIENVLHFALLSQDTRYLLHLSRVCRWWHTLFSRSIFDLSIFNRKNLEDVLEILKTPTPIHVQNLTTQEPFRETWLHHFLASPILHIKSTSTLAIRTSAKHLRFMNNAPSFLSQGVPCILRHAFTEVHTLELSRYSFPTWTRFAQVVFAFQRLETLVCSSVTWATSPTTPPTWLKFSKRLRHASFKNIVEESIAGLIWLFLVGRPRELSDDLKLIPSDVSIIGQLASLLLRPDFSIVYQKQDQPRSCTLSFTRHSRPESTVSHLSFQFEENGGTHLLTRIHTRLFSEPDDSTLREIGRCSTALSSANSCHTCFELSDVSAYKFIAHAEQPERRSIVDEALLLRRRVAKAMMQQHSAGLLKCTCDGEAIEDTEGVQWLKSDVDVTFGVEKKYKRGTSGQVTWDVEALRPHFLVNLSHVLVVDIIPWVKLYQYDQISDRFIADVAFNIAVEDGHAEFLIPEVDPGLYFLAVGDYVYRTEPFEVVQ